MLGRPRHRGAPGDGADLLATCAGARDLLQAVVDGSDDLIFARDWPTGLVWPTRPRRRCSASERRRRGRAPVGRLLPGGPTRARPLTSAKRRVAAVDGRMFEVEPFALRDACRAAVGTISIARDVTERVAADSRLHRLQSDLARAGRLSAVAAMGAGLAHELHQPLSAAANFLAVAMRRLAGDPQPAAAAAGGRGDGRGLGPGAADGRDRQAAARLHRRGGDAGPALAPLVREAAEAAWRHARPGRARLHVQLDDTLEALVDRVSIQQVVSNLVRNAAEAVGAAGRRLGRAGAAAGRIGRGERHGQRARHRPGGPDRLFDVFSGSGKKDGLGVGLAICRTIVAAHGGWITAANHAGGGAAFMFTLPPRRTALGAAPRPTGGGVA